MCLMEAQGCSQGVQAAEDAVCLMEARGCSQGVLGKVAAEDAVSLLIASSCSCVLLLNAMLVLLSGGFVSPVNPQRHAVRYGQCTAMIC